MTCQEYLDRLLAGLDDGAGAGEFAQHETACVPCHKRGASMRAALDGIAALPSSPPTGFAKGAWHRVASARAPWETHAPPLTERIAAWFSFARFAPLAAGAVAVAMVALSLASMRPSGPGDEVARVAQSTPGVEVHRTRRGTELTVPEGGHANLELGGATTVTLTGPAVARARTAAVFELDEGLVMVNVNHDRVGKDGFSVVTPHLALKVTGTEFTVRTTRDESVVELFAGRVELESGTQTRVMQPNERVRSGGGGLEVVTAPPRKPVWPLPPTEPRPLPAERTVVRPAAQAQVAPPKTSRAEEPAERNTGQAVPVNANASLQDPFKSR